MRRGRRGAPSRAVVPEDGQALVLLIGAGLLIQTLFQIFGQYSVLEPEKVLTMRTVLPPEKYEEPQQRNNFYRQVLERVERLPGVVSAGYSTSVPLAWKGGTSGFYPEGIKAPIPGMAYDANHRQVSADYLKTMNVPLRAGRYFDSRDNEQSMPVAIINETMARQYWPGENALGRRFKIGDPDEPGKQWKEIVGIVADIRQMGLDEPVKAEMYMPYQQITDWPGFIPRDLAIRTSGDTSNLVGSLRQIIRDVDPDQPGSGADVVDIQGDRLLRGRAGGQRGGPLARPATRSRDRKRKRLGAAAMTSFDDAVVQLQDRDPLRDQGPFSEIAVTGRIWSGAAALSDDSVAIDGRLDRIRRRVELMLAPPVEAARPSA